MLLAKVYKTYDGARKRADFENAHQTSLKFRYIHGVAHYVDGREFGEGEEPPCNGVKTFRVYRNRAVKAK